VLTLGFGQDGYRVVESTADFRMSVDALREAMSADRDAGVKPVAVVATLGTTSSASIDPVREIAEVAREFGAWLHVDAAYGGPAAIVPELRPLLDGWELADSIVVNPHKWLFTPIDCSVLYSRRPAELVRAFSIVPEYLTSPELGMARNLMDYGVSLGRRFRALKLWFVLRYFGRQGLIDLLRAHVRMAHLFEVWVRNEEGWAVMAPAHLGTVAYRYAPSALDGADQDAANHRIMERVNASGEAFLTHTVLNGRVTLRLSIGNVKTAPEHVSRTWTLLQSAAAAEATVA
jgi:aromatic-L-amino-acid decarboxylase